MSGANFCATLSAKQRRLRQYLISRSVIQQLQTAVGKDAVISSREELLVYSYDATLPEFRPDVVVFPTTAEQVAEILKLANEHKLPVVPRGAGTNLSGGSLALDGGIILCLSRMTRILAIDRDNLVVIVEPGVVNAELQAALAPLGLFYPPDPASMNVCTLGGNVAENSGGPRCLKYGVTRDYVLGLEVVLPTGEIIHTGGSVMKNCTGYDFTRLFVGSEGTLGVVTRITLRVLPLPEAKKTMLAVFDSVADASNAVSAIIARGIIPTTLELMDRILISCAEDFVHVGLPKDAAAVLLIEIDGFRESLDRQVLQVEAVCQANRVREIRHATTGKEVDDLWLARRTVIGALARLEPNYSLQDVTVPRSKLPAIVARIGEVSAKFDIRIGVLAHAGDGNLHPIVLFDERKTGDLAKVHAAEEEICRAALALGGTLSGEHGIGLSKRQHLPLEYGPVEMSLVVRLKQLFDPNGILNPGKIVNGGVK
ncbi:MAG: FAD-linked oxidase C-terminal domain-containing protein [Dehalococcoidia bacterium]|nr:FAD-linked oxidase C-terminal domain-containing protein [Dehalococcoidia bacterium]